MLNIEFILKKLSTLKPTPLLPADKKTQLASKIQNLLLTASVIMFLFPMYILITSGISNSSVTTKNLAIYILLLIQLLTISSFLIEMYKAVKSLIKFKEKTFKSLLHEINEDEKKSLLFIEFNDSEIEYAKYWINMKISRYESRISLFFGRNSTIISLLGLTWSSINSLDDILNKHVSEFTFSFWMVKALPWIGFSLLLAFSLGGIAVKRMIEKYRYQTSILDLTLKLKSINKI